MRSKHSSGAAQALYRVLSTTLSSPSPLPRTAAAAALQPPKRPRPSTHHPPQPQTAPFSSTPPHLAKTRLAEIRTEKWDEEIAALQLHLVDPTTNELYKDPLTNAPRPPRTRYDVLRSIDRTTHRLVQVQAASTELDNLPVCKIVSKKAAYQNTERRKREAKEKKRAQAASSSLKTLELNWAIDGNDLRHRLERVAGFLAEGRKVEVILAAKKKGRKASEAECEGVLERLRGAVGGVEGAREVKRMEGKVGGFAVLEFQGKVGLAQAKEES